MSEHNLDVFFDTFESDLESALSCLENENLLTKNISPRKKLVRCFPELIAEINRIFR